MRSIVLLLALGGTLSQAQPPAPQTQQPVFRTGVDLLTVDATVVDRDGRQITDLTPGEFIIEVDGKPRPVVSAEYVKLVDDTPVPIGAKPPAPTAAPDDAFFSSNTRAITQGRQILILVDEGNIRLGQGRLIMRSAAKFVDGLHASDRLAMVAIPQGRLVDFTTNHERVREALLATVGRATPFKGRFFMSLSEAIATVEGSDSSLRNQLILRECAAVLSSPVELTRCEIEVEQEAGEYVNHQRLQTSTSIRGMREVLRSLAGLEGPKSVILISEGLVLEGLGSDVDEIAAIAGDVRANLDVLLLDVPAVDVSMAQRPTTPREDREREVQGLESLAGMARGALHRIIASGDYAFGRIQRSMSGHYLIGVEARPADRDGKRHRIEVKSTRRGLTVYSRRGFLASTSPTATSPADAVGKALRAPLTINDVPMRFATWTYKEPGGSKVRVLFTAEIQRATDQSLDYTAGLLFVDRNNRVVVSNVESRTLRPSDVDPGLAVFAGSVMVEPGTYMVRFSVADNEGRLGSIERKLDAWAMNATGLTVGDLLVSQAPDDPKAPVVASIEPRVSNGRLSAMMEVYAPVLSVETLQATLEVLVNEKEKPLTSSPLRISQGSSPEIGVLHGIVNTAALPPGRYLARATIVEGGKARGHIVRPFHVVPGAAKAAGAVPMPSALPAELLSAMTANLPLVDRKDLLEPAVLKAVLNAAEKARPAAKAAFDAARAGKIGPAALEALGAGDQATAAFLRGIDFYAQGNDERAMQQLQVALQQAPTFAPTRLYLGALLAQGNRHREAASLLQSVGPDVAGAAPVARMAGLSWLRSGDAHNAITALEKAGEAPDAATSRTLALAYVVGNRPADAVPLLARYLEVNPKDQEALLAGVYATYAAHSPVPRGETLSADQARAQGWAKAYFALKGPHQGLVDAWIAYLQGKK